MGHASLRVLQVWETGDAASLEWAFSFAMMDGAPHLCTDMSGDVNLFWNDHDDPNTAEIEVRW